MARSDVVRWSLVIAILGCATLATAGEVEVGAKFPEISGKDALSGKPVSTQALAGKVVVVDFWATWCGPCRREIPHIRKLYEEHAKDGLEIVGVSLDRDEAKLKKYIQDEKLGWHHIYDKGSRIARRFDVTGIPMVYVIGRDGKVLAKDVRGNALSAAVARGLKQPVPDSSAAGRSSDTGQAAAEAAPGDAGGGGVTSKERKASRDANDPKEGAPKSPDSPTKERKSGGRP